MTSKGGSYLFSVNIVHMVNIAIKKNLDWVCRHGTKKHQATPKRPSSQTNFGISMRHVSEITDIFRTFSIFS
jgi:hypothetical protein